MALPGGVRHIDPGLVRPAFVGQKTQVLVFIIVRSEVFQGADIEIGIYLTSLLFQGRDFLCAVFPGIDDQNLIFSDFLKVFFFHGVFVGEAGQGGYLWCIGRSGREQEDAKKHGKADQDRCCGPEFSLFSDIL